MQLKVSRGAPATGKTIRLRKTAKQAGLRENHILVGTSFFGQDLEALVVQLALRGAKVICIDECSEAQLAYLERAKTRLPDTVTVHVVVAN